MTDQDGEVKQGTGRLLGLFFGLVIVCALFFGLGYSLGRRSAPEPVGATSTNAPANMGAEAKPSPTRAEAASKPDCATPGACPETTPKSTTEDLTFYKAVEQNQPKAKLEPPAPPVAARVTTPKPVRPEAHRPATLSTGFMVQVAAVGKQEDAEALAQALRKKSYPVVTISGPNDKFYHVQVGPFANMKDAEATRNKLIGDGYNPILKK